MESDRARLEVRVRGRVQGVGFRVFAREWARELRLGGFVANEPDGTVRVVAEGPRAQLERLLEALRRGPVGAHVQGVETAWAVPGGELPAGFEVRL
jgi:acylphosphatase